MIVEEEGSTCEGGREKERGDRRTRETALENLILIRTIARGNQCTYKSKDNYLIVLHGN